MNYDANVEINNIQFLKRTVNLTVLAYYHGKLNVYHLKIIQKIILLYFIVILLLQKRNHNKSL
ncbi:hypothetical protein DXB63_00170 [Bacteroides sp. OM05-12]|nr:hypothetical protein DXB63_00170 [Bacteroides sp. OM05-12]